MHAFQVQQLQLLHPGTPQCKSLQLQASRVTIATATVQLGTYLHIQGCSKVGNVNTTLTYQLQSGRIPGQGAAHSNACCPELSVFTDVRAATSYVALAV